MPVRKAYRAYRREGLGHVISGARYKISRKIFDIQLIDDYCHDKSLSRLRYHMERENTPGDVIDTAYNFEGLGNYKTIRPMHAIPNGWELLDKVNEHDPEIIVEIGAGNGGSFYMWSQGVDSVELIVSIDIDHLPQKRLLESFQSDADLYMLQGNSHSQGVLKQLKNILDEKEIDFLYIDGDHSYEGVLQDFEMYSRLVADGGIVILDDVDNTVSAPEVPEAWSEIKENRDTYTIKESEKSSAQGIVQM